MADNLNITEGAGTVIAADDVAGAKYQRVKLSHGVDGSAVDASVSNPLPTFMPGIDYTDRSGTVTLGNTAQTLMAANAARKGWRVQNLSSSDLWFNDKGSAAVGSQPSSKLVAGAAYESPAFGATTAAISIIGATTGQAFEAMEA